MELANVNWEINGSETGNSPRVWVQDASGKRICNIPAGEHDLDHARLMAASPRMARALQRAAHVLAELPAQGGDLIALREELVACISMANPRYYGLDA